MARDGEGVGSQRCLNFGVIEVDDCSLVGKHVYLQEEKIKIQYLKQSNRIFQFNSKLKFLKLHEDLLIIYRQVQDLCYLPEN